MGMPDRIQKRIFSSERERIGRTGIALLAGWVSVRRIMSISGRVIQPVGKLARIGTVMRPG